MTKHNATNATDKRNAVRILANGDATVAEVARLLGTSRQLVAHWAKLAGLEPVALRADRLERLWRDERQARVAAAQGRLDERYERRDDEWQDQPAPTGRAVPKRKRLK